MRSRSMPAASIAATSLILTPRMNSIVRTRRALRAPSTAGTRTPSIWRHVLVEAPHVVRLVAVVELDEDAGSELLEDPPGVQAARQLEAVLQDDGQVLHDPEVGGAPSSGRPAAGS